MLLKDLTRVLATNQRCRVSYMDDKGQIVDIEELAGLLFFNVLLEDAKVVSTYVLDNVLVILVSLD